MEFRLQRFVNTALAASLVLAGACTSSSSSRASTGVVPTSSPVATTSSPASPTASTTITTPPTPPAIPRKAPPTSGPASLRCVHGWVTPPKISPLYTDPLGIIRSVTRVKGPLVVVDLRSFTGPESPPSDKGYLLEIQRWYVKLYAANDLSFQGRFLVEARRFGRGLSAVAPYDTKGFHSPDWRGFQYDSENTRRGVVPGLPGTWSGVEYDFVKGGPGLTIPGLPHDVVGCLTGT